MSITAYREIIQRLMEMPNPTKRDIDQLKFKVAGKHSLNKIPANAEIIQHLKPEERVKLLPILRRKTVRTISGVTVVAVMTEPSPCPKDAP
ncbi:MAG: tRNA uridine(34) 5-carboxymethylaminomethyl modification radical SAM/GNAT enzyme Elp3, partial [Candidatus Bathyarchaeota archaeon]|nr:tRNA uridine(34) 5-carboxymethylaminomethyl modification radical SAM/GNAT enzyme Elp3 [Candidatus Bathyarchaeum sp.]